MGITRGITIFLPALCALMLSLFVHSGCAAPSASTPQTTSPTVNAPAPQEQGATGQETTPVPAEKAGWTLHFSDDFKYPTLEKNWKVLDGNWKIEDGTLKGSGMIVSKRGFPDDSWGFTRLEYEVQTDAKPLRLLPGSGDGPVAVCDLSAVIHSRPPEKMKGQLWQNGYFFQFGGNMNERSSIRRDGADLITDEEPATLITPGKIHRIIAENDQGQLRFFVDGKLILKYEEKSPLTGGREHSHVGFYLVTQTKVHSVKVYIKRLDDMDLFI